MQVQSASHSVHAMSGDVLHGPARMMGAGDDW